MEMNQIIKQNMCQSYGKPSTLMRDYTHTAGPIFKMINQGWIPDVCIVDVLRTILNR